MLPQRFQYIHSWLYFIGLSLIAVGLPFSLFLMSTGQMVLLANWILEGRYNKLNRLLMNRQAWFMAGLFLIYLPGLFYSENTSEALKILRINLPFLVLPFILAQHPPLEKKAYFNLIRIFLLSVLSAAAVCLIIGIPNWLNGTYSDIRQISLFISHIRFALLITLSVFLIAWLLIKKPVPIGLPERIVLVFSLLFLVSFLLILQSLTGLVALTSIGTVWGFILIWQRFRPKKAILVSLIPAMLLGSIAWQAYSSYRNYFTPSEVYNKPLPEKTRLGNRYDHRKVTIENGYFIETFQCIPELEASWKQRSSNPLRGEDGKGNRLMTTLIRYLNSKGLPKDAQGVSQLSNKDIAYIEKGIANVHYTGLWGIKMRFYQLLWEANHYRQGYTDASGHTIRMKLAFWQAGVNILRKNPVFGVGIGDVPEAFKEEYQRQDSWLSEKWRLTSHNQYLYIAVAAGIPGLILFVFLLVQPLCFVRGLRRYPPFVFFILIALISMLTEDTLTTQAGVTFVAFFYGVFLFLRPSPEAPKTTTNSPLTPETL